MQYLVSVADAIKAVLNDTANQTAWGAEFTAERDWTFRCEAERIAMNAYRVFVVPAEGEEAKVGGPLSEPKSRLDVVLIRRCGSDLAKKDEAFGVMAAIKKTFAQTPVLAGAPGATLEEIAWAFPERPANDGAGLFVGVIGLTFRWAEDGS